MRSYATFLVSFLLFCSSLHADNLEKTQKKELESQVKAITAEAQALEKSGHLAEARTRYAESQALIETKDVTEALKHLDEQIHKRVKDNLSDAKRLYEARKFKETAVVLEESMKFQAFLAQISYDLALCYYQLGDRGKAVVYLGKARLGTADPKQKQRMAQLLALFITGENGISAKDSDKDRINRLNHLVDSIGLEASLDDEFGEETSATDADPSPDSKTLTASQTAVAPTRTSSGTNNRHRASLCNSLGELKGVLTTSPSALFDLANCAETNGRATEAVRLLGKYLEAAPTALDADETRTRIAELQSLLTLPGQNGIEVRRLYASAYGELSERKYDRAVADLTKARDLAPDFPLTTWKLALYYEAIGDIDRAREHLTRYRQMASEQAAKEEADLHLSTLEAKRTKYDEEVDATEDIVADLFSRSLKLSFDGSENRSALRVRRAHAKKKEEAKARNRVGGFAIPYAYAQQQLSRASAHLQVALALFPLGAEANELMALVFLQANDGQWAMRSFDVVASQGLPVSFYAEMRGHKQDQAVKCELSREHLRLISLSSYDKKGSATPPAKPAGDDGLGDLVVEPAGVRQLQFDSLDLNLTDIKKVETDKGLLKLKLVQQELSPGSDLLTVVYTD